MFATPRRRAALVAIALIVLVAGTAGYLLLRPAPPAAAAQGKATLTVFIGSVQVARAGSSSFAAAHSGDQLGSGDQLQSSDPAKAILTYPDGSITRLDAATTLKVRSITAHGSGWDTNLQQDAGKTWNVVGQLAGGSFRVHGPNNSTAEVRGTKFSVIIGTDSAGNKIVEYAVWEGSVLVSGSHGSQIVTAGNESIVGKDSSPTPPNAIPGTTVADSFTVFNQVADVAPGTPVAFQSGKLSAVSATPIQPGASGDGSSDLQFTLGWPGSSMRLTVLDCSQDLFQSAESSKPPVSIVVAKAQACDWSYKVTDLQSAPNELWWVIVSRVTPSTQKANPFFPDSTKCDHTVVAGQVDTWTVSAQDSIGKPALSVTGLTKPGSFTDGGKGRATITFSPDILAPTTDMAFKISAAKDPGTPASLDCVEHILAAPRNSSIAGVVSGGGAGVTLSLDPGATTTATDGTGSYSFTGLGPGHYTVTLSVPAGFIALSPTTATADLVGTDGVTANFSIAQVPTITGIAPSSGSVDGGTSVSISGSGMGIVTSVTFDGLTAPISSQSAGTVVVTTPGHAAGPVTVVVASPGGTASTGFTYFIPAPVLRSVSPNSGSAGGGTTVTITGTHLGGTTAVTFGGTPATGLSVLNDGAVTVVSPAHSVGTVDVRLTTPQGTTPVVAADLFAYLPWVTAVAPAVGPAVGGTSVGISGVGFGGATSVKFGDVAAVSFTVDSDTHMTAVSPQHVQGAFHLYVAVPGGATVAHDGDTFTFQNWTRVRPDTTPALLTPSPVVTNPPTAEPQAMEGAAMAYNPENNHVLLFGGISSNGYSEQTFEWNGVSWTSVWDGTGSGGPGARAYSAMTFDPALHLYVMIGGESNQYGGERNDVWTWDGTTWTAIYYGNCYGGVAGKAAPAVPQPATSRPSSIGNSNQLCLRPQRGSSLVFDSGSGKLVLYGGSYRGHPLNETWTSVDGRAWQLEQQSGSRSYPVSGRLTLGADGRPLLVGAGAGAFTQYTVPPCTPNVDCYPYSNSDVLGMVGNPVDGNVWFTEGDSDVIGKITPAGVVTRYHLPKVIPTPTPTSYQTTYEPQYMLQGPDGKLYFNLGDHDGVGRIDPAAQFPDTSFQYWNLPPDGFGSTKEPLFVAVSGSATTVRIWVAETEPHQVSAGVWRCSIARLDPSIGSPDGWTEFNYDCLSTGPDTGNPPTGLTLGSDGNIWFTTDDGRLGKILVNSTDPASIQFFDVPNGVHGRILNGPDNKLWWAGSEQVGWVNTTVTASPAPSDSMSWNMPSGLDISRMAVGPDGNIWLTEGDSGNNNFVARVTLSGQISEFPLPVAYSEPTGIAAGPDGRLWISLSDVNTIIAIDTSVATPATFLWDAASATWVRQANSANPPAREMTGLAFDRVSGKVVLFGGQAVDGSALGDTWTWDGSNWTQENPVLPVSPRYGAGMSTDSYGGVVLFGGVESIPLTKAGHVQFTGGPSHNDVWKWI